MAADCGFVGVMGMGLVSPLGIGVDATWRAMLAGVCGVRPIDRFPVEAYGQQCGGQLAEGDESALLASGTGESLATAMILRAAGEALGAGFGNRDTGLGLILATNFGVMDALEWSWRERIDTGQMDEPTFLAQQDVTARVAAACGAAGPTAQISLSCASGAAAVTMATEWIRGGRASRVLAVGYDLLTEFCWCGLSNLRTITDDRVRPFDRRRRGTIFSEGAAAMLLSGRGQDRDSCPCQVLGGATNNNAFHMTAPTAEGDGSRRVMAAALRDAGVAVDAVDFVSAHGTGTIANDRTESQALANLFGERSAALPVAAFKSQLGHLLGAAGLAEAIVTAAAIGEGRIPPIINSEESDDSCHPGCVRGEPLAGDWRVALTNSAGIGGNNAATVLGCGVRRSAPAAPPTVLRLVQAGWVLPGDVAAGPTMPPPPAEATIGDADLADFSAKPYLKSVKGYLDPSSSAVLAAGALCAADRLDDPGTTGIVVATQYGAPQSGMRFYGQLVGKGARLASPMVFPHSYGSTPGDLLAIELGCGGPHVSFITAPGAGTALGYAADLLRLGKARDLLFVCYEAVGPECVPDGWRVLNGAVCLWLTTRDCEAPRWALPQTIPETRLGTLFSLLTGAQGAQ